MYKVYLASVGYKVSHKELKDVVAPIGTVKAIEFVDVNDFPAAYRSIVLQNSAAMPSYRFGFVEMTSKEQAESAIDVLKGIQLGPGNRLMLFGPHGPGDEP